MNYIGCHVCGFICIVNTFTIKWVDASGSVTNHDVGWSNFWTN